MIERKIAVQKVYCPARELEHAVIEISCHARRASRNMPMLDYGGNSLWPVKLYLSFCYPLAPSVLLFAFLHFLHFTVPLPLSWRRGPKTRRKARRSTTRIASVRPR